MRAKGKVRIVRANVITGRNLAKNGKFGNKIIATKTTKAKGINCFKIDTLPILKLALVPRTYGSPVGFNSHKKY